MQKATEPLLGKLTCKGILFRWIDYKIFIINSSRKEAGLYVFNLK
jgi:hypothetical protein